MKTKNPIVRSSTKYCFALAVFWLFTVVFAQAQVSPEIFLNSTWINFLVNSSISSNNLPVGACISSGGNKNSGTTNDSPHSANGFCLAESTIGQITAPTAGYPNAANDLATLGNSVRTAGKTYQFTNIGPSQIAIPAVAWNVIFPGGFNPANGSIYSSNVASTYTSSDIFQADYILRARLQVNPADPDAAQQLVLLVDDQILPLEWAGTMASCYSTYARIIPGPLQQNGTNEETIAIEQARAYYLSACNVFAEFLANPYNADLIEGQNPLVSAAVTNGTSATPSPVQQIVDDYLRVLNEYAQASLSYFQLSSEANFYDPTAANGQVNQALLKDIDNTANQLQYWLLLASPFEANLPVYTAGSAGQISSTLHDIRRLHQSILLGRVTFNAGASDNPEGDPSFNYGEFTTSFVPFFNNSIANLGITSFQVALNFAQKFTAYAANQEASASNDITAVLQRQYDWTADQQNLQNQYQPELENLCGYLIDMYGDESPDVFTAALPPASRDPLVAELDQTGYQFNESGTIYQQWQAVQTDQTNLLLASIQLSNTVATMVEDSLVGNAIYSNQVQFAELILTNGQQISAIDVQQGQVQAQAILAVAQIQAVEAQTEAENTGFGNLFNAISIGGPGGGSFNPGAITSSMATIANGYDTASADLQIGNIQANEATQIAALNSQIEQINANEQAQAEYVQANTTMLNLSAQLNALGLQANSQEVQIQIAAQQLDQDRSKLANQMAQVSSILNQWLRSAQLTSLQPQFTSDLLLIRDATVQQANDAFTLAQEWCFLAALAFNYESLSPESSSYVPSVLAARNAGSLMNVLNYLESANALIPLGFGQPNIKPVQFSIRNNFFQSNTTTNTGTNTLITSYEPVLQGGLVLTNAAASQTAWINYLMQNVKYVNGDSVLKIHFSTDLAAQWSAGIQSNPLYSCDLYGTTLFDGVDATSTQWKGVQISFSTQGLSLPSPAEGFSVVLTQDGTSSIRTRGYSNHSGSSPGYRYFNFGEYPVPMSAAANNLAGAPGTGDFQNRSPANSDWTLTIQYSDSLNNQALLNNLAALTDIQLQFSICSYLDNQAYDNCTQ